MLNRVYKFSLYLEDKGIAKILILAFVIRFVWWLYIAIFNPDGFWLYDSYGYYNLAYNISHYGVFSRDAELPLTPDYYRTPLYPFFIVPFVFFDDTGSWICLVQVILSVTTVYFIYKITQQITSKNNVALLASFFFAVDINQSMLACYLLTETLFIFLLTLFIYFFVRYYHRKKPVDILFASSVLGMAVLCRPVATYLFFIPVFILLIIHFNNVYVFFKRLFLFKFILLITLAPWLYRNYNTFKHTFISLIGHHDLLNYHASGVYASKNHMSLFDAQQTLRWQCYNEFKGDAYMLPYEYAKFIQKKSLALIAEYPLTMLYLQIIDMVKFFIKPGMGYYKQQLGLQSLYNYAPYKDNNFLKAILYIIVFYQVIWLVIIYTLIFIFFMQRITFNSLILFLLLIVLYFSILTVPPHTDVRFRSVVSGILVIFAVLSILQKNYIPDTHEN
jgi:4-amino-4-deoxy-L-arabinose transferase-like glycosyltransferase